MRVIYKYPLTLETRQSIHMPMGAKLLSVQAQFNCPCLWALVDPEAVTIIETIYVFGTGHQISKDEEELTFLGTVQLDGGALVFHVYSENVAW